MPAKAKSAGILCGLRTFLTQTSVDKRLFQAVYHYGALPNGEGSLRINSPHEEKISTGGVSD